MAAVETVTIGANTYSVYGLGNGDPVADADEYFAARLGATAWTGATADQKRQALVTGVRFLDRGVLWSGEKTASGQPLQWPRDGATCRGESVPDGTIPDDIALGEFELALALLEDESVQDSRDSGSNVQSVGAGSARVAFFRPTQGRPGQPRFPQVVHELVGCYSAGSGTKAGPFVDGTDPTKADESSHFCDPNNTFGLTEGYP